MSHHLGVSGGLIVRFILFYIFLWLHHVCFSLQKNELLKPVSLSASGGEREGHEERGRELLHISEREREEERREVSCASCHAIHLLRIQRDGGPVCCLLLSNKVK